MTSLAGLFKNEPVAEEFERRCREVEVDFNLGLGLSIVEVLKVHFLIVDLFYGQREGLGGIGPKDIGLLSSAVARQFASFGGVDQWQNIEEKAATLMFGLIKNHPFHDANKRTAFLSVLYLLRQNGLIIRITEQQFEDFTVEIADDNYRKREKYIRTYACQEHGEVKYISNYLRNVTRQFDKRDYIITYRELDRILRRFDFGLFNPMDNHIDVCRIVDGVQAERICRVGFPSWTKQVLRHNIKYVRQQTGLDALNGVDSEAFFRDAEPVSNLMAKYYEPLVRLADR